jgi:hypothetical protein
MIDVKAEREARLEDLHPVFRELDTAVAHYIDLVRDSPQLSDEELENRLTALEVEESVAHGCITFVPLAFGRAIVKDLGVSVPDSYIEYDLSTKQQTEKPLGEQFEFIWAKSVLDIYRQSPEYNSAFKTIAVRSAEVDAINSALHGGCTEEDLRESNLGPPTVFVGEPPKRWWQFWRKGKAT